MVWSFQVPYGNALNRQDSQVAQTFHPLWCAWRRGARAVTKGTHSWPFFLANPLCLVQNYGIMSSFAVAPKRVEQPRVSILSTLFPSPELRTPLFCLLLAIVV